MQSSKIGTILCPVCGISFQPEFGTICSACTIASAESPAELSGDQLRFCRFCGRYERPPWVRCERESQEMLAIALKKIHGLKQFEVISAKFLWTEPHSRRVKVQLMLERELNAQLRVRSNEVITLVERDVQCPDCKKNFTDHDWIALVQVRQEATHRKTLLALEQNLLRQKFSQKIMKVSKAQNGLDLYFRQDN